MFSNHTGIKLPTSNYWKKGIDLPTYTELNTAVGFFQL